MLIKLYMFICLHKNTRYKKIVLSIVMFLVVSTCFAQHDNKLDADIEVNSRLFKENISEAYKQVPQLLQRAKKSHDKSAELLLLDRTCRYYYSKNDVNNLILSAHTLSDRSAAYGDVMYRAMSHTYRAEAYSMNKLFQKAIDELDTAMKLMDDSNIDTPRFRYTYSNILLSQANQYLGKKEYPKAVKKVQQAVKHYPNTGNPEALSRFQYINYADMASIYAEFNVDSAYYYANRSARLKPQKQKDDGIMGLNYYVMGKYYQHNKDTQKALDYYLKTLEIYNASGEEINLHDLYKNIVSLYEAEGNTAKAEEFTNKLNLLEYNTLKSKYNSLQHILASNQADRPVPYWLIVVLGAGIFIIGGVAIWFFRRKKAIAPPQLAEYDTETVADDYKNLIDMLKRDDSAFIVVFEKLYPDFVKKLLDTNPSLVQSEIEFCALLRMKLSTKQISQLTHIEVRTVQNKKHRIRKKLDIPADKDLYVWFDEF